MKSDQFSDCLLPFGDKRCSKCGELSASTDDLCTFCREMVSPRIGSWQFASTIPVQDGQMPMAIFGCVAFLFSTAVALAVPQLLLLLLILVAMSLLRTVVIIRKHTGALSKKAIAMNILSSVGAMVLVGLASIPIFACAYCGLSWLTNDIGGDWIMPVSIGISLVPGIIVCLVLLLRLLLTRA